ncbi:hypothetical protein ASF17_03175 [Frigoribacterium sp. Leaf263]|uniref:septum formation family protein n=1 Tax=Frigoribacterium sp. Leaf263 TaxID=1736313 RepID=UPI0006F4681E|nr:septum formation family protein [Frigoribacterium sp. Leaf263]KQO84506.1 hypothetical protein ASF17_03175 [Frigoribacterium sp. Leaf263]
MTNSYLPPLFDQLAARLRRALPGVEIDGRPSDYLPGGAALRLRLGHRLYLDLADDGREWFVAGLSADAAGVTPVAERSVERLGLPLHSDQAVVVDAVVASVGRWVEAVGPDEADAPAVLARRPAPPAIPSPSSFGAPTPAPYIPRDQAYGPDGLWQPSPEGSPSPLRRRRPLVAVAAVVVIIMLGLSSVGLIQAVRGVVEAASSSGLRGGSAGPDGGAGDGGAGGSGSGTPVDQLRLGDCFSFGSGTTGGVVVEVERVECTVPHDNEVFFESEAAATEFPGEQALTETSDQLCFEAFPDFVGLDYESSVVEYDFLQPTEEGWRAGDRVISCYVYVEGRLVSSSLRGFGG